MIRKIIHIEEEKCNGCGLCARACHEGAIGIINGRAKLLRDDYCDGLGACLPVCPAGAISFIEREAEAYDHTAVMENKKKKESGEKKLPCGCPGSNSRSIQRTSKHDGNNPDVRSQLSHWPVQIKLVSPEAGYLKNCDLLIAADCTAYAYGNFHNDFIKDRVTLIGCPKLDSGDYTEKLTEIISRNDINSITVVRMEVPCCGGMERAVAGAVENSGKQIPLRMVIVSLDGKLLN